MSPFARRALALSISDWTGWSWEVSQATKWPENRVAARARAPSRTIMAPPGYSAVRSGWLVFSWCSLRVREREAFQGLRELLQRMTVG